MHEPNTPPRLSSPTASLDLTNHNPPRSPYRAPLPPHMTKFHSSLRSPFSVAYRRVHSRRERIYSRSNPDLLAERLDISEDTPFHSTLREKALLHISYAYACAGYAHAALCIIVSLALAALVFSFAKSLYADVIRKTRIRADDIAIRAAECYLSRLKNDCIMSDDGATTHHPTPALDTLCKKWLACERRGKHANADAYSASVWAETAAETINSFAERIHSTAVVISVLVVVIVLFIMSSAAFGFMHVRVADTSRLDRSVASDMLQRDDGLRRRGSVPIAYDAQGADQRPRITAR